jgi:hypothetical protein
VVLTKYGGRRVAVKPGARRRESAPPQICVECLDLCVEILSEELDD